MERFIKKHDCWLDTKTGLEWELNQNKEILNYKNAIKYCEKLGEGWRSPSREELFGITNHRKCAPATDLPDMVSSYYWSSTTSAYYSTDYAWYVSFYNGLVYSDYKSSSYYVRAVRGKER